MVAISRSQRDMNGCTSCFYGLRMNHILVIFIVVSGTILWLGSDWEAWSNLSTDLISPSLPFGDQNTRKTPMCLAEAVTGKPTKTAGTPSTADVVSQLQDSSSATVMAMATGYGLDVYQRFVGSLRKTGYQGHIILAVSPDLSPDVEEYLVSKHVTIKKISYVNCSNPILTDEEKLTANSHAKELVTCLHPYPSLKHRWARFPLLRKYLQDCSTCTGPVLVSDVRDTIFQRDPFGPEAPVVPPNTLQVFQEFHSTRTTHWLVDWPVYDCKGIKFDEPMLCSGTTIGTRSALLEYLRVMHAEMNEWMQDPKCCCFKINGDDQTIHNYLFYTGKLNHIAVAVPNRMGLVHTVGGQAAKIWKHHVASQRELLRAKGEDEKKANQVKYAVEADSQGWLGLLYGMTDNEGYFVNFNGERSFVVHQIDRFGPQYFNWLEKNKEKLYL